ncbi:porin [Alteromonas sp. C1M14]|uniref:OmpP1/FadL family transporter n=1 Tax=Alteromonas sp. C1M14 TaxID=2841567 RepID=UPI001C08203A|nr:porin [Alteromonas sp. C1M14]MBU2977196.1 outer membrane protein transport protein [Alteromonas sp. C1M14]
MKQRLFVRTSLAVTLTGLFSSSVFAAGFQVNEHSANGLGRAMAGQAALPENATILATNPAAITAFRTSQFSAQVSYLDPEIDIRGEMSTNISEPVDASEENIAESAIIPSLFYTSVINDKLSWGLGLFTSYGLATDYSDSYNALNYADEAEIFSFTVNPAIAYKVTDTLSLGLGLNITYADAKISTSIPQVFGTAIGNAELGNLTIVEMSGDDIGYGWNVGVFWEPTRDTNVGLSYRAETQLELEGEIKSDLGVLIPEVDALYNQGGSLDLNFAAITELAVSQKLNEKWSVQASVNYTDWSTFDKLEANLDSGYTLLLKEEDFEDTWRWSAGVTYQYDEQLTLRAGYAYDEGAVSYAHRSLSIPDTDRHWVSVGGTYKITESTNVDLAYVYIKGREADVYQEETLGSITTALTATEHATAQIFSVQVNTAF